MVRQVNAKLSPIRSSVFSKKTNRGHPAIDGEYRHPARPSRPRALEPVPAREPRFPAPKKPLPRHGAIQQGRIGDETGLDRKRPRRGGANDGSAEEAGGGTGPSRDQAPPLRSARDQTRKRRKALLVCCSFCRESASAPCGAPPPMRIPHFLRKSDLFEKHE